MDQSSRRRQRRGQIEQLLANSLSLQTVRELGEKFPLIAITRVELTADLKDGVVYVTAAPQIDHHSLVRALNEHLSHWRPLLRRQFSLRYWPNLAARYDEGQAESLKINHLLEDESKISN